MTSDTVVMTSDNSTSMVDNDDVVGGGEIVNGDAFLLTFDIVVKEEHYDLIFSLIGRFISMTNCILYASMNQSDGS